MALVRPDRIFVVGDRGMLGRDLVRWLREQAWGVVTTEARFGPDDKDQLIDDVVAAACPVIVNCAAALPGRSSKTQWLTNALLPIRLASVLTADQTLIHASTDGVFSGSVGPYSVGDWPDATDTYGRSKRAGEFASQWPRVIVLRTSILGTSAGLLGWLLAQTGEVEGYGNHLWSGVTTLEWSRQCLSIVDGGDRRSRIEHLASPAVSKFRLLAEAARVFEIEVRVREASAPVSIDRTLVPTIAAGSIDDQLADLRRWDRV
jgi:dTDP-4-dehydrorhamnose reductase